MIESKMENYMELHGVFSQACTVTFTLYFSKLTKTKYKHPFQCFVDWQAK